MGGYGGCACPDGFSSLCSFLTQNWGGGEGGGEESRPLLDPPLSTCSKTTFMQLNDSNLMDTLMCDSCTAI